MVETTGDSCVNSEMAGQLDPWPDRTNACTPWHTVRERGSGAFSAHRNRACRASPLLASLRHWRAWGGAGVRGGVVRHRLSHAASTWKSRARTAGPPSWFVALFSPVETRRNPGAHCGLWALYSRFCCTLQAGWVLWHKLWSVGYILCRACSRALTPHPSP